MTSPFLRLAAALLVAFLAACSSDPSELPPSNPFRPQQTERELRLEAEGLYKLARRALESSDFVGAIRHYDQIQSRYPFTDYATQAQLESIFAKYRSFDPDGAITTADRFLKEHPRHAAVDYVHYLKGLTNFERGESAFDWIMDPTKQDVGAARKAFDDFSLLCQRYPNSRYVADARLRMTHLRNRIAEHELHVVRFYMRRGGYLAAAKRAERIVSDYPGAPATVEALETMEEAYREIGLNKQADEVQKIREANKSAAATPAPAPAANAASAPPALASSAD